MDSLKRIIRKNVLSLCTSTRSYNICDKNFVYEELLHRYASGVKQTSSWDRFALKDKISDYLQSMKCGDKCWQYGFSNSSMKPSIYTATYALMLKSLLFGEGAGLSTAEHAEWVDYFLTIQDPETGYFIDPSLEDGEYISTENENDQWWGYGHVLLQVITCLQILKTAPLHPFSFLDQYTNLESFSKVIDGYDWGERIAFTGNKVMNIGVALQYQVHVLKNHKYSDALNLLFHKLDEKVNSETGVWFSEPINDIASPDLISQIIQGAYHFWPLYHYEKKAAPITEETIRILLSTQNVLGGFGVVAMRSSGCEDMDSIEPLTRFLSSAHLKDEVLSAMKRAMPWVLANMNEDGGFIFQHNTPLHYGHYNLRAKVNESSLFATWWRVLGLSYLLVTLGEESFYLIDSPGYQFPVATVY